MELSIPPNTNILCDRNHFSEALYNILLNGWEAQQSAGRDTPLVVNCHQERLWTVVEITDCGNGIPKAQLRHIYEPFFSSKNTNLNWGMGLYYVRQIIRSHLGVLRIETRLGSGTTFIIQLPRCDEAKNTKAN
ncbi:MAG: HAMP domain-containing sensor histidine kinase [Clostridia bacterium]|nr:HAMP domain-containing sensor histidine kinase [Clostridia bacterium]